MHGFGSAVPYAPSDIVFMMFVVDGGAAPDGPMTYVILRAFLGPLEALEILSEASESRRYF